MAEALTAAHIIRAVIHIQAVQDLLTDHLVLPDLPDHPTDHPGHLTGRQDLLIHITPEVQEAANTAVETAVTAVAEVAAADALPQYFSLSCS